jgi:hypothetical protein
LWPTGKLIGHIVYMCVVEVGFFCKDSLPVCRFVPSFHKLAICTFSLRVGIAQSVQRQAMGWTAWVRFPAVQDFSLLHSIQTGTWAHPASCPMGTGGSFPGGKVAGT